MKCLWQACSYFSSNAVPLKVTLVNADPLGEEINVMFKVNFLSKPNRSTTFLYWKFYYSCCVDFELGVALCKVLLIVLCLKNAVHAGMRHLSLCFQLGFECVF